MLLNNLEDTYEEFTNVEKSIADFFMNNKEALDFSSKNINKLTQKVITTYQCLLNQNAALINEEQMYNIARLLTECKKVYVYGMGSSGITAQEFKLRFMRLGLQLIVVRSLDISMRMSFRLLLQRD